MLSGLSVCATLTALVAGVAGAWSPCGFSMVETIGSAMGESPRRAATLAASVTFAAGALLGGVLTFGGLAVLGSAAGHGADGLREGLGAALALAAAIADWRGVRIAPQIRRQVPESWRRRMPLTLACALYGVLLGLAFTTFVLAFAVWALAGISFAAGDPALGATVGLAFGLGRAVPVLWMAPGYARTGGRRLDRMAREPRMWLGLRRLDALGLGLCALFLSGASATAAVLGGASDPSAGASALAWQRVGGSGELRLPSGATVVLPGVEPALGGSAVAWQAGGRVTVASLPALTPLTSFAAVGVDALALSDTWVAYRDRSAGGQEDLLARPLSSPSTVRRVAGAQLTGEIGRPSLSGSTLVFAFDTPERSAIESLNLATGTRRVLRQAARGAQLLNPSLLGARLLYERLDRCSQQLRLGAIRSRDGERMLLKLPSAVRRDPGYERAYEHAYNSAALCPNRGPGAGTRLLLGPTALGAHAAYVTELRAAGAEARILALAR